jgi:hypothetical protein
MPNSVRAHGHAEPLKVADMAAGGIAAPVIFVVLVMLLRGKQGDVASVKQRAPRRSTSGTAVPSSSTTDGRAVASCDNR